MKRAVITAVAVLISLIMVACGSGYSEQTVNNVNTVLDKLTKALDTAGELKKGDKTDAVKQSLTALAAEDAKFAADKENGNEYKTAFSDEQFAAKAQKAYDAYTSALKNTTVDAGVKAVLESDAFQAMRWLNAVKDAKAMFSALNSLVKDTADKIQKAAGAADIADAINGYSKKIQDIYTVGLNLQKKYPVYHKNLAASPLLKAETAQARKVMVEMGKAVNKTQEKYSDGNKGKTVDGKIIKAEEIKTVQDAFENLKKVLKSLKEKKV